MSEKLLYGIAFVLMVGTFYYFYDDIFDFLTDSENQAAIGREWLGVTRQRDR